MNDSGSPYKSARCIAPVRWERGVGNHTRTGICGQVRRGQLACAAAKWSGVTKTVGMKWPGMAKTVQALWRAWCSLMVGVVLVVTLGTGLLRVRDAPGDVGARWATCRRGRLSVGVMVRWAWTSSFSYGVAVGDASSLCWWPMV